MRALVFPDRPRPPGPRSGPLHGRRVILVVAPTETSGPEVRLLERRLRRAGAQVMVASECHGEARDEHRRAIDAHRLLIEVGPSDGDAVVFVGGPGASRVAEDQLARDKAHAFAAAGRVVAAVGQGRAVLSRAGVEGMCAEDAPALAAALVRRFTAS